MQRAQSLRQFLFGRSLYRICLTKRVLNSAERWYVIFMHVVVRRYGPFATETDNFATPVIL